MIGPTSKLPLKPTVSLRDRVYEYVKSQIINGQISSAEVITEINLSKTIGISRTPVREALHYLEKEGLLVSLPKKGYNIRLISNQELIEICEIRLALESLSIKWAIDRITSLQLRVLEENIITSERRIAEGDVLTFIELDGQFHELIAQASGNPQIVEIVLSLRNDMIRSRFKGMNKEGIKRALQGHRNMFKCINEKDALGAEMALREHLEDLKRDSKK